ncbi:MAG: ABC transporter ATP-binding protein [Prevotella sp.]|nr:ABC transporter ATP-binding protein [Prevotella sp.]
MMLELHHVTIGSQVHDLSLTVDAGQLVCLTGAQGSGKTTLIRAVMGFIPVDGGHICIDGELLTPQSAYYFRRQMAYVPQRLSLPDGYTEVNTDYLWLLNKAVNSDKPLLIIDEPQNTLPTDECWEVDRLLMEAARQGKTLLAVNDRITQNQIRL